MQKYLSLLHADMNKRTQGTMKILLVVNMVSFKVVSTSWSSLDSTDMAWHLASGVQINITILHQLYVCPC